MRWSAPAIAVSLWSLTAFGRTPVVIGPVRERLPYGAPSAADVMAVRTGYVVGFNVSTHNPDWVCYRLTKERIENPVARRVNDFRPDPEIPASAQLEDYRRSGYDRGHMVPAGSMKSSVREMSESFLLTNMCPQDHRMNSGAWNRIEEWVRECVGDESSLYVITGPVYDPAAEVRTIGTTPVRVPDAFFKVVLDETPPRKMIAFLAPNEDSKKRPWEFAVSVDAVERATGLDFFPALPDDEEERLESQVRIDDWRFRKREKAR